MRTVSVLLALTVAACSADSAPTAVDERAPRPMPDPAHFRVIDAGVTEGTERTAIVAGETWIGEEIVTLDLENDGGPGRYLVEFWGRDESDREILWHRSFPTNATGLPAESATFDVDVPYRVSGSPPRIQLVVVFTHQPNFSWLETSRFDVVDQSD